MHLGPISSMGMVMVLKTEDLIIQDGSGSRNWAVTVVYEMFCLEVHASVVMETQSTASNNDKSDSFCVPYFLGIMMFDMVFLLGSWCS